MDFFEELQKIENLLDSARRLPGLGTMIDERQLKEAFQRLQQAVPQEVRAAQQIIAERDSLINRAVDDGKQISTAADQEFQARVSDSPVFKAASKRAQEITAAAQQEANAILSEAEKEAKARRDETDHYADDILHGLDAQLSGLAVSVRKGVAVMEREVGPLPNTDRRPRRS